MTRHLRRALLVPLLALSLGAGCGGGDGGDGGGGSSAEAAIAEAALKTTEAGTYRASFEMTFQGLTRDPISMRGEGLFDGEARRGRMTFDMSELGAAAGQDLGEAEIIFDELVFYMNFPALTKAVPEAEPWIRFDLEEIGKQQGLELGQLAQLNQGDPSRALEYLRGASENVREVGEEDVRGTETTHYRMTVDLDEVAEETPAQKKNIERVIELSGVKEVPTDVWLDSDGRVRRMKLVYRDMRFSPRQKGDMTMTMELYEFGVEVSVEPPAAEDVTDVTELIGGRTD